MSLYRVAQVELVDQFSPESTSVCHDFIRILRECRLISSVIATADVTFRLFDFVT